MILHTYVHFTIVQVIMMVGLPAAGKTKWAEKYCQDKPDMNVNILGTNFIMDKMKVHTYVHNM